MIAPPRSPSDLGAHDAGPIVVAGRVVRDGEGLLLCDAFASVALDHEGTDLAEGDLAVVRGDLTGGRLSTREVLERARPRSPRSADTSRFRDAGIARVLALRSRAMAAVRAYFEAERFVEVETPCLVPSPGLDRHLDAFEAATTDPARFLITSPEYQMKRLVAGGVPRCFQIARCFRRGEIGGHHNPEFTMLEWYRAFSGWESVVRDTEEIVRAVAGALGDRASLVAEGRRIDLAQPFQRVTVAEAFRDLAGIDEARMLDLAEHDEEAFFRALVDRVEPALATRPTPIVLHRYPAKMASLARLAPDDPRYAERFEIYVAGIELSNGFGELTDADEQRARLERDQRERRAAGQPVYPIDDAFLAALEGGFPPSAGNALGLDRLVMLASGRTRIGDVLAFPEGVL